MNLLTEPLPAQFIIADYQNAREKFIAHLEDKYMRLAAYAKRDKASQFVIDQGNAELDAGYEFVQQIESLMWKMHGIAKLEFLERKIVKARTELSNETKKELGYE
jgi:hypothetical protein